jgi:hypothetical protein
MKPTAAAAILVLSGCATTPLSIEREQPKAVYSMRHPVAQVERCLFEKLANYGGPSIIRGEGGVETLAFGTAGIISLMIDLSPDRAIVRSGYPYFASVRHGVESCVDVSVR